MAQELIVQIGFQLLLFVMAFRSYKRKSVNIGGAISMVILGAIPVWTMNWMLFTAMAVMFLTSTFLTNFKRRKKDRMLQDVILHQPRNALQGLANLGLGSVLCVIDFYCFSQVLVIAATASVAAANADTWSSELGVISKKSPRLILSGKKVPPGISGGVSLLGSIAGIAGSFVIALVFLAFTESLEGSFIVLISGIFGFSVDSVSGELFQALYLSEKGSNTEHPSGKLVKGLHWITNDFINFICTFSAAALSFALCYFF